jgi:hypothetical protein
MYGATVTYGIHIIYDIISYIIYTYVFYLLTAFGDTGIWAQSLTLARQLLYHLSHKPSPFFTLIIFQVVSHIFATYSLPQSWDDRREPPSPTYWLKEAFAHFFCLGLVLNHDPLISASQVARITGVSHHTPPNVIFWYTYTMSKSG